MHPGSCCAVRWLVVEPVHPALAGHFPGRPIVPGVVLLDLVIELLQERLGPGVVVAGLPAAKFLHPVRPGEPLLIGLERVASDQVRFICRAGLQLAARGSIRLSGSLTT